jgi:uncharacterized protein
MVITFDPVKNARNIRERDLSFQRAVDFDFETAIFTSDERREYGETRIVGVGCLDGRLHVLCFVETGADIRVVSFSKANMREANKHDKAQTTDE